ncbi:MAG: hypothetical protein AAB642_00380 [Patescibacteria group bacterium]
MEQSFLESGPEKESGLGQDTDRLEKIRSELYRRNALGFHEVMVDKAEELQSKYPDYREYRLYHLLISSTVGECPKYDFPGEDSIELFLETQQKTLPPKK